MILKVAYSLLGGENIQGPIFFLFYLALVCIYTVYFYYLSHMTWLHELKSTPDLRFWWYGKGEKAKKAAQPAHNSICAVSTTNIWFIPLTTRSSRSCQHLSLYSKSSVQRFFSLFLMSCVVSLGDLFKAPLQSKICFSSFPYTCSCTPMSEILCVKLQYVCSESVEWMLKYPHAYKESVSST